MLVHASNTIAESHDFWVGLLSIAFSGSLASSGSQEVNFLDLISLFFSQMHSFEVAAGSFVLLILTYNFTLKSSVAAWLHGTRLR